MSEGFFLKFYIFVQSNSLVALGVNFFFPKIKGYFLFFIYLGFLQLSLGVKGVMVFFKTIKKIAYACSTPSFTRQAGVCQPQGHGQAPMIIFLLPLFSLSFTSKCVLVLQNCKMIIDLLIVLNLIQFFSISYLAFDFLCFFYHICSSFFYSYLFFF